MRFGEGVTLPVQCEVSKRRLVGAYFVVSSFCIACYCINCRYFYICLEATAASEDLL